MSYLPLDQESIAKIRGESDLNLSYSHIHVYYQHLAYTRTVEFSLITPDYVLTSIGGLLGLYLGASIVSMAHITFVMLQRVLDGGKVSHWKNATVTENSFTVKQLLKAYVKIRK